MQYEAFDVAVIGAGHAGCEAALASARLGLKTIVFTVSVDSIAMMPCNPNIGGTSKGHLVREIDALGGEMGKNIDRTFIQSKMLNTSKGPAVHSLRAQADKKDYSAAMRNILENTENLTVRQDEVVAVLVKRKNIGEYMKKVINTILILIILLSINVNAEPITIQKSGTVNYLYGNNFINNVLEYQIFSEGQKVYYQLEGYKKELGQERELIENGY